MHSFLLFFICYVDVVVVENPREPSLLCIVKWGGELTPRGRIQAEEMGRAFRQMYPGGHGMFYLLSSLYVSSAFRSDSISKATMQETRVSDSYDYTALFVMTSKYTLQMRVFTDEC